MRQSDKVIFFLTSVRESLLRNGNSTILYLPAQCVWVRTTMEARFNFFHLIFFDRIVVTEHLRKLLIFLVARRLLPAFSQHWQCLGVLVYIILLPKCANLSVLYFDWKYHHGPGDIHGLEKHFCNVLIFMFQFWSSALSGFRRPWSATAAECRYFFVFVKNAENVCTVRRYRYNDLRKISSVSMTLCFG
jgi:hypothetical protein